MKKILLLFVILTIIIPYKAMASLEKSSWKKSFWFGYGNMNANQTQTVHVADTPPPGLDNGYLGNSKIPGAILIGFALEKEINSIASAGVEIDYLGNKTLNGTVEPMINVSSDFDTLNYFYDVNSLVFQATTKFAKQEFFYNFGAYIQAGAGAAINRLSDYYEYSPEGSTAAPMLFPYRNKNTINPAVSAGIGITYKIGKNDAYVSLGYRYFYVGKGQLLRSPNQETNNAITLSSIRYQFLVLSLTV